jgi:DNA-binding NarL/FixJ family response regulator
VDKECKVIILTADIQNKTRENVMALGASVFMNKPVDAEKLAEALVEVYS